MLKFCGVLGLILSCGIFGINKSQKLHLRIELLEDFYQMILDIKGQINYFKEPLTDIFMKTGKKSQSNAFLLLTQIHIDLEDKTAEIANLWPLNVKNYYKDMPLTKEDLEIMSYVGEFIGQTDYLNQIQHFTYTEHRLKVQIQDAKDNYKQKSPLYSKVGFFVGGLISIIFI